MTSATERGGDGMGKEQSFSMLFKLTYKFKLKCYNFRILNVIPMAITRKIAKEYTKKEMRKEFKLFTTEKSTNHKRRQ